MFDAWKAGATSTRDLSEAESFVMIGSRDLEQRIRAVELDEDWPRWNITHIGLGSGRHFHPPAPFCCAVVIDGIGGGKSDWGKLHSH
jgi:hypothetical protein